MYTKLIFMLLLAVITTSCSSVNARGGYFIEDGECRYSKDLLDDFGPGVEHCREEAARRLNKF